MRDLTFWFGVFTLFSASVAAQTTADILHNRYARPNREEMQIHPGISITVQYGLDLQACEIRVHTTTRSLLIQAPDAPMFPEIVTEIINEIAPMDERGKPGMKMITSAGCNVQSVEEYERITITRSTHEGLPLQPARENPALLIFKKPECVEMQKARLSMLSMSARTQ
jgi:hypothetical protein